MNINQIDKAHVNVNDEDIEEHLFKFYSPALIAKQKDQLVTKNKTFKIIKIKLKQQLLSEKKVKPTKKTNEIKEENDGWYSYGRDSL